MMIVQRHWLRNKNDCISISRRMLKLIEGETIHQISHSIHFVGASLFVNGDGGRHSAITLSHGLR